MTTKGLLIFTLVSLLSVASVAGAQNHVINDTLTVEVRQPPAQKIVEYSTDEAFQYDSPAQESDSLLLKAISWLWQLFDEVLENNTTRSILKAVLYLAFGAVIILLVNQFIQGNISGIFRPKNNPPPDFTIEEGPNAKTDIEPMIRRAIEHKQYNLAIRLLYKQCLIQLQEYGWINWQKNKTNHDYIYEIKQNELQEIFREVTQYYEYAQYGNFSIGDVSFQRAHQQFKQIESIASASS